MTVPPFPPCDPGCGPDFHVPGCPQALQELRHMVDNPPPGFPRSAEEALAMDEREQQ